MLLAFMGIGGAVTIGYTQGVKKDAEHARYMHNIRVLNEAKQALLQYAYNHPVRSGFGPGRMPCPDTDNDGIPESSFYCIDGNAIVGRFPWFDSDLDFYDARDASGERLWYAVSRNFAYTGPLVSINSDTTGTITIHDQTGALVYDGLGSGVAAVIIAPGPAIDRNGVLQDRSVANGDDPEGIIADTDPGIVDPVNYLDLFGALDNADFINDDSGNGFVLGPVDDLAAEELIVNDQMVVITAEEVIAMAEKATLQAYRDAIRAYDQRIDNDVGLGDYYPWLYNYAVNDYGVGYPELDDYPSAPAFADEKNNYLDRYGRVPSIYTTYFTETDGQPIESYLDIDLVLEYPDTPVAFNPPLPIAAVIPSDLFDDAIIAIPDHVMNPTSAAPLTGVQFQDIDPDVFSGNDGRLIATVVANETFTSGPRYFWDEHPVGNGWVLCINGANDPSDCHRDGFGVNYVGPNITTSQILRVQVDIELEPGPVNDSSISFINVDPDTINDSNFNLGAFSPGDLVEVEGSASNDGIYNVEFVSAGSLTLYATEQLTNEGVGSSVTVSKVIQFEIDYSAAPAVSIVNEADANRHANIKGIITGANINAPTLPVTISYIYDDEYIGGFTAVTSGTLSSAPFLAGAGGSLALTMRYYPELPRWAFDDGWHDAIQMAYASDYRPDVAAGPCTPGVDCLAINNLGGIDDNKISILAIGGEHDWIDSLPAGLADDLGEIFDPENDDLDDLFDAGVVRGNDKIMVIDEI